MTIAKTMFYFQKLFDQLDYFPIEKDISDLDLAVKLFYAIGSVGDKEIDSLFDSFIGSYLGEEQKDFLSNNSVVVVIDTLVDFIKENRKIVLAFFSIKKKLIDYYSEKVIEASVSEATTKFDKIMNEMISSTIKETDNEQQ